MSKQISYIKQYPPSGPESFFITYFDYDQLQEKLRGHLWGVKHNKIQLFDGTESSSDKLQEITKIHYLHEKENNRYYFRLQVHVVCSQTMSQIHHIFAVFPSSHQNQTNFCIGRSSPELSTNMITVEKWAQFSFSQS